MASPDTVPPHCAEQISYTNSRVRLVRYDCTADLEDLA